jgi:hypothetical protein
MNRLWAGSLRLGSVPERGKEHGVLTSYWSLILFSAQQRVFLSRKLKQPKSEANHCPQPVKGKGKGKVHLKIAHEGPEGE